MNNGWLRGLLYFTMAALAPVGVAFEKWSISPPSENHFFVYGTVVFASIGAGLVAWRAYIDQHLARNGHSKKQNTTNETSTDSTIAPADPVDGGMQNH